MKPFHILGLIVVTGVGSLPRANASIGLLPDDKKPVLLEQDERNPFAVHTEKTGPTVLAPKDTEETSLRALVSRLPISGITRSYGVTKVLLGSFMVEEGQTLPVLVPRQTESLKVLAVSEKEVQLSFVEKDGSTGKRTIELPVDLSPSIRYQLKNKSTSGVGLGDAIMGFDGEYREESP